VRVESNRSLRERPLLSSPDNAQTQCYFHSSLKSSACSGQDQAGRPSLSSTIDLLHPLSAEGTIRKYHGWLSQFSLVLTGVYFVSRDPR